jgi:hypothetical protein
MPSDDLKGDALAVFAEHGKTILTAGAIGIVLLLVLVLLGGIDVVGGLFFLGYAVVWLAVLAFVLWLFYRLVTAVERIAAAQERMASARDHGAVETATTDSDPRDAAGQEFVTDGDESTPGVDDGASENE